MKKYCSILLILLLPIIGNAQKDSGLGWLFINTNTIKADKQEHAAGGMFIGLTSYALTYDITGSRKKAKFWGIAAPIIIGTFKELSDIKTTGFDFKDLAYTAGGGIFMTYTFNIFVKRKEKRNKL